MFKRLLNLRRTESAFSLVELLVVIVILGIIFAIAVPIYNNQVREAELTALKADIQSTSARFSQWQQSEGSQYAVPDMATFNSQIVVTSSPDNVITFTVYDALDDDNWELCILGTRTFASDDIARWNFNSQISRLTEGACVNQPNFNVEIPN